MLRISVVRYQELYKEIIDLSFCVLELLYMPTVVNVRTKMLQGVSLSKKKKKKKKKKISEDHTCKHKTKRTNGFGE